MKKLKNDFVSLFFVILCIFQLNSCSTTEKIIAPIQESKISPGVIKLTYIDGLSKKSVIKDSDTTTFYMGDLKGSRDFYFLIRNTGGSNITNINILSSNPTFQVSPSEIQQLEPDSIASISPIIRISAIHGMALDGVGYTELMPMDTNISTIDISGITLSEDSTDTTINLSANIIVNSLVMDVDLMDGSKVINLNEGYGGHSTNLGGLGFLRVYECDSIPSIKNIGNIPIYLTYPMDLYYFTPLTDTLNIGDILTLDIIDSLGVITIQIDGKNTICDNNRLQIGNDGKVYFALVRSSN